MVRPTHPSSALPAALRGIHAAIPPRLPAGVRRVRPRDSPAFSHAARPPHPRRRPIRQRPQLDRQAGPRVSGELMPSVYPKPRAEAFRTQAAHNSSFSYRRSRSTRP